MLGKIINNRIRATVLPKYIGGLDTSLVRDLTEVSSTSEKACIKEYIVKTADGAELSTVRINPFLNNNTDINVLHFLGSSQTLEMVLPELIDMSFRNKCLVTSFNYRGVADSIGVAKSIDDLFNDCVLQVETLFRQGAVSKKLLISGFSLGGGLATKVVSHYHRLGQKLYLFNDRSFGRLSDVAGAWYGDLFRGFFRKLLNSFDWEIDADKFYLQIPEKYKRHINLIGVDDEVVPFYVSLSKRLKDLKQRVNDEFLFYCSEKYKEKGHKAPLSEIMNKYGETGERIFSKFIEEIRNQVHKKRGNFGK